MVYTQNEKERMERLLEVFETYVAESTEIDIAYAEKTGYVRLIVDACADSMFFPITGFDDLLDMFVLDIIYDVMREEYECNPALTNQTMNYGLVRQIVGTYLSKLDADREYAHAKAEEYITRWQSKDLLP